MSQPNRPISTNQRPESSARIAQNVATLPVVPIAVACGLGIAVLVVLGTLQRTVYPSLSLANLDAEASLGTWFSASLLWLAAAGWFLIAVTARSGSLTLWTWSLLLVWLALDEGNAFHEHLERWSGVDWQILYLPVLAVGALAWWGVLSHFSQERRMRWLLLLGAAAWAIALVLELVQNWGGSAAAASIYDPTMIIEEALEMVGSTAFIIAALYALRAPVERR
jgi:hypothetical protein